MSVMDFNRYKEINDQRLNYREMEDATVVSNYRNVGCGDGYRIYLKIDENRKVTDASYTTTGCGFGIVALAMATEIAKGKSIDELKNVTVDDVEKQFEFPERRKNYPESAVAALQQAIHDYETGAGVPKERRITAAKAKEILSQKGNLRGEDLSSIILEKEDLHGVDFSGANLNNAFLTNCNFSGANFEGARLRGAFLNGADLTGANLKGVDLRWAKLAGAKIEGADFTDAVYDIGTRVDQRQIHIFSSMKKEGKDIYMEKHEAG
ncbi:pentapeptide repeat-containing protein [Leptospira sp. WS58.C1]|uniref:pentapeptide repeat-containing protein n=1 Tax=Leptospira TaxID=171 RepID=UPI0002BDA4DE|nr:MULTISPECIES: pentapeptide repeat-containing protein [unclassified Leptospira]EMJ99206.1 NifU-like N-terminal domain protein [Leptospira sp. B5-022]MCR1795405.1 pentapeptide repeat-containing protein [Leptospira sp. id769339]